METASEYGKLLKIKMGGKGLMKICYRNFRESIVRKGTTKKRPDVKPVIGDWKLGRVRRSVGWFFVKPWQEVKEPQRYSTSNVTSVFWCHDAFLW